MRPASIVVGVILALCVIPPAAAQDTSRVTFAPPVPRLPVPSHPALAPGGYLGARTAPETVAAAWETRLRERLGPTLWMAPAAAEVADTTPAAPPEPPRRVVAGAGTDRSLFGPYADLGMRLNLRLELKADQFTNLNCSPTERLFAFSGCDPGFPTITPNPQYQILTSGVVGQRLHINVDFDSEREFDANNNLQVWYEGLEDEMLRRVEAGNVTFQAPPSRFISAAIPANNFGIQAIGQIGPLELRGIYAQQKGNVIRDRFYTIGEVTSQPLDQELRDLDYEVGRFFFAIDPAGLPGFPAIDILELVTTGVPDSLRVGSLRVYRVRAQSSTSIGNQNIGGVRAVACGAGTGCTQRAGPFQWEILVEGRDYYVDPTGAWFALTTRLAVDDYLGISYIPAGQAGCGAPRPCVGTFPTVANPDTAELDSLRLVYDPRPGVTAASPSFRFEIRSAYRVGGSELTRDALQLVLTVNERERSLVSDRTYLDLMGLALPTDVSDFDEANRLFPRGRDPGQGAPLRDFFAVLPHLAPFADSTRLAATERNDSLYRTPRAQLVAQAPPSVFEIRLRGNVAASGDRGSLALNSFQIRESSERLYLRNRLLERDVDYTIDYATGTVQFKQPDSLFAGGVAQIRAQFEERAAFVLAPTAIFGVAARYDLGTTGYVAWTGLFQNEQSSFTRPPLGYEPSSSFIGGISTQLRFQPSWLTAAADALPGVRTGAPSFITVAAEVATSRPQPNPLGQAYIEEFEGEAGRFIPLQENAWRWGSMPSSPRGVESQLGVTGEFTMSDITALTWQGLPISTQGVVQFFPQQIDPTIRVSGQGQSAEPVLWLVLKPDTVLGLANSNTGLPNWVGPPRSGPRWRSITQSLSATGLDLSRTEFIEFWVWEDQQRVAKTSRTTLVLDFGSVFEDAAAILPREFQVTGSDTTYFGVDTAGPGRFDSERDQITHAWSAVVDDNGGVADRIVDGIVDLTSGSVVDSMPLCSARSNGQLVSYFLGDLRSRCGRDNGIIDTEDLDGDQVLDIAAGVRTNEDMVRYVFPIGDERYYVRDGGMITDSTGTSGWRLYRIPFRLDTLRIGQPNLRQVQSVRLTVLTPPTDDAQVYFALSRLRLVGSSWLKRAETPIVGLSGDQGTGIGEVVASVVSTENRDLGYEPPPGVSDVGTRRDAGLQVGTTQINERSLRLLARGLTTGRRAEAFLRFTTEGDKNFLKYRRLRVWARGRGPGWDDRDLEFYIKAGKDANNFYFYHVPARTSSWEPEVVVDFDRWLTLRAEIERAWLDGDTAQVYPGCPDSTIVPHTGAYVRCDGPYIVHVRDPGTAPPNLARVQEIAAGMLRVRENVFIADAELWVDDIRLSDVVEDVGYAGALDITLAAADVVDVAFSVSRRDGRFRQLGEDPSYITDDAMSAGGTLRLDRFFPARWGLVAPLTVRHVTTNSDPFYLNRTDLRADALGDVRTPHATATSYALALRRNRRSLAGPGRFLLDPLSFEGTYIRGGSRSDFSNATGASYGAQLDYNFLPGAARARVASVPLRVSPTSVRLRSGWLGSSAERAVFSVPVIRPGDDAIVPTVSQTRLWRNQGSIDFQPLSGLQLRLDLTSQRDLKDYGDSTTAGRVAGLERKEMLGIDVGMESLRSMTSVVAFQPGAPRWLRPRASVSSGFALARDPNAREPVREVDDTGGAYRVPVNFSNQRRWDVGAQFDLGGLGRAVFGDSAGIARALSRVTTADVSVARTLGSSYSREAFTPSIAYQLGFGGLDNFRQQDDELAASASANVAVAATGALVLPFGLRATTTFRQSTGTSWVLRTDQQVPVETEARDWPTGSVAWTLTGTRPVTSFSAQLGFRESLNRTVQPGFEGSDASTVLELASRSLTPSVTLTWVGGILTSADAMIERGNQLSAGNHFRTERAQYNVNLGVSLRPPANLIRMPMPIRATARFSHSRNTTCLQAAGREICQPFVDSRQTTGNITFDTEFPPSLSAGLQMGYVLNEELQASRKTRQIVVTAFVNLGATVGRLQ